MALFEWKMEIQRTCPGRVKNRYPEEKGRVVARVWKAFSVLVPQQYQGWGQGRPRGQERLRGQPISKKLLLQNQPTYGLQNVSRAPSGLPYKSR